MDNERRYEFSWNLLGDVSLGRPNLGSQTRLEVYRLMQYCFRDVIERTYGSQAADGIFYDAGYLAGQHLYLNLIGPARDFGSFITTLQHVMKELRIGIVRLEEADLERGHFTITVSEDLDCSGLPETGYGICTYDEGFLAALLEGFTGRKFVVKEIDCWCTGDRNCRFAAQAQT